MILNILIIFFVSGFVFFFGCILASIVHSEYMLKKINKKVKTARDNDVNLKTEKIRKIDNE